MTERRILVEADGTKTSIDKLTKAEVLAEYFLEKYPQGDIHDPAQIEEDFRYLLHVLTRRRKII